MMTEDEIKEFLKTVHTNLLLTEMKRRRFFVCAEH